MPSMGVEGSRTLGDHTGEYERGAKMVLLAMMSLAELVGTKKIASWTTNTGSAARNMNSSRECFIRA
jgi:hypothetical protein